MTEGPRRKGTENIPLSFGKLDVFLMEKIEEKRYNSLGFSPKLAIFYQFRTLFVNVDVA